jgi:uncharacterized membrane protein YccC
MRMPLNMSTIRRLIYSHHFLSGIRRGVCVLFAFGLVSYVFNNAGSGLIAGLGASCVALIDQTGHLKRRILEMLWGVLLGGLTVALTGFATPYPVILIGVVIFLCFGLSMLQAFGPRGGVISLACLLLMTITMHTPLSIFQTLLHVLITMIGAILYVASSLVVGRITQVQEEEQTLTAALLATSDYIEQRGLMYDPETDVDEGYNTLMQRQSKMIAGHQAVRDVLLPNISENKLNRSTKRKMTWNVFVEMVGLLDLFLSTQNDYKFMHRDLAKSDSLIFIRDALFKYANEIERLAVMVTRGTRFTHFTQNTGAKAELRALDYELEKMQRRGFDLTHPESFSICTRVLKRLKSIQRALLRMRQQIGTDRSLAVLEAKHLQHLPPEMLTRHEYRLALIVDNLRWSSSVFRFSLRLSTALGVGMLVAMAFPILQSHSYWMLITIIVIMRPSFSTTSQRNNARLFGTVAGCGMTYLILSFTQDPILLTVALVSCLIIGSALTLLNYLSSSFFTTIAVLIALQFLILDSYQLAGDRAIETVVGSIVAFGCSYLYPWWEARSIPQFAHAAREANAQYLIGVTEWLKNHRVFTTPPTTDSHLADMPQDDLSWHLGRKNVYLALSNFTDSLQRMMLEPKAKQIHVAEFNHLLIQNHTLVSRTSIIIETLFPMNHVPLRLVGYLESMALAIQNNDLSLAHTELPEGIGTDMSLPDIEYLFTQLRTTIEQIILESQSIHQS